MIDFVVVEKVLVCAMVVLFVIYMVFAAVYFAANLVEHVNRVRRNIRRLNGR